jgi:hypothetical protein
VIYAERKNRAAKHSFEILKTALGAIVDVCKEVRVMYRVTKRQPRADTNGNTANTDTNTNTITNTVKPQAGRVRRKKKRKPKREGAGALDTSLGGVLEQEQEQGVRAALRDWGIGPKGLKRAPSPSEGGSSYAEEFEEAELSQVIDEVMSAPASVHLSSVLKELDDSVVIDEDEEYEQDLDQDLSDMMDVT